MSIEAMVGALNHSKAQGAAHIVLLNIANHQGEQGAWPSIPTLARLAKVSDRRVQQILNELVAMGELRVDPRAAGYGSIKTNRYWVTLTCPATCDGTFAHRQVKPVARGGEVEFTDGVKPVSLGGEVEFTQNNIKPKEEPIIKPVIKKANKDLISLPEDWQPDEHLLAMFATKWPLVNKAHEIEAFKLYYWSKGTEFKRWDLTFQRWMNDQQKRAAEKQPAQTKRNILGDF
jgi:hypothetical protein